MRFLKLIGKHVPPYTGNLLLYILFVILTAVFSVFSFSAVIPLLKILFGLSDTNLVYQTIEYGMSWSDAMAVLENNILYCIQGQIAIHGEVWALFLIGLFVILTSFFANASSFMADYCRVPIRTGILRDVRKEMYDRVLLVSNDFLTKDKRGDAMSRMTSDALEFEWCIADALNMLVKDPIKIIIYMVTLFVISWKLALVSLCLLFVFGLVTYYDGNPVKRIAHRGQAERGEILSIFDETLGSLTAIKAYNSEFDFSSSFGKLNERNRRTFTTLNRVISFVTSISDWLIMVALVALMWIGGGELLAQKSALDAANLIYFLIVFYSVTKPTIDLASNSYGIRKCMASVERVDKILNLKIDNAHEIGESSIDISDFPNGKPLIEFRNVHFSYADNQPLFNGINFSIDKGQSVALMGRVGSGKSTIAGLLMRLYEVSGGTIFVAGKDINSLNVHVLRGLISYVCQEPMLFNCSIYDNILLGRRGASQKDVEQAARQAGIHEFISNLPDGYQTIVGDRGSSLSGGQKQSISIARAILKNAPILVLDEATASLDPKTESEVINTINSIAKGRTILTITHHQYSDPITDKILILKGGKVFEKVGNAVNP